MAHVHRAYRQSTRVFGVVMVLIGAAMIVTTIARGGGPLAYGVLLGALFAGLGAARFHLAGRTPREPR
jgi:hypothetical protein